MTHRMLMGVETEYAATTFGAHLFRARGSGFAQLLDVLRANHPHVADPAYNGVFLGNGARFYLDCCSHPELTTPECSSPREVVAYLRAGDRMLAEAARVVSERTGATAQPTEGAPANARDELALFRTNVDYVAGTTWGCHESYMHRCDPERLPEPLIPHLVSRVIYAGSGGFSLFGSAPEFTLSPRAWKLDFAVSHTSTESRAIVHTKDEPLSKGGYHRLHLICGESLCSEIATFLKVGTTALVVAAVDAGWKFGDDMQLLWPVSAMRMLAADPSCRVRVALRTGQQASAIEIQRYYLRRVEECRDAGRLPEWADDVCQLWGSVLDNLERDPAWAERVLDWGIKQALYRRWLGDEGWQRVRQDLVLRNQLFEIDARFGQLGANGIFHRLETQGLLDTRLVQESEIQHAMTRPPAVGRARVRGALIRQLSALGTAPDHLCDWNGLWNRRCENYVDLTDPFEEQVRWGPFSSHLVPV